MIMFGHYKNKTEFNRKHAIYEDEFFGSNPVKVVSGWKDQDKLKKVVSIFLY